MNIPSFMVECNIMYRIISFPQCNVPHMVDFRAEMPQAQAFLLDELEETQAAATSRAPSSLGRRFCPTLVSKYSQYLTSRSSKG